MTYLCPCIPRVICYINIHYLNTTNFHNYVYSCSFHMEWNPNFLSYFCLANTLSHYCLLVLILSTSCCFLSNLTTLLLQGLCTLLCFKFSQSGSSMTIPFSLSLHSITEASLKSIYVTFLPYPPLSLLPCFIFLYSTNLHLDDILVISSFVYSLPSPIRVKIPAVEILLLP